MTEAYDDWPVVVGKLNKAQNSWTRLTRILVRESANPRVLGTFFNAVVQAGFIFGLETWVLTPRMVQALGIFHQGLARRITWIQPQKWEDGGWDRGGGL